MEEKNRLVFGVLLIAFGLIFLLDQFGILTPFGISPWFLVTLAGPAFLVYLGYRLYSRHGGYLGLFLIVFGLVSLLGRFMDVNFWSILWPLVIISFGLSLLFRKEGMKTNIEKKVSSLDEIYEDIVFWGIDRKITSKAFKGGEVNCIFGGGKLDLSKAKIDKKGAKLEVNCVFGGLEVIVPKGGKIVADGSGAFGGWTSKIDERESNGPVFKISGSAVFGGVVIKG